MPSVCYHFRNGTGVRCHAAGWGMDEIDGTFQFIPKKQPGTRDQFQIHPSEVCAGGEVGKDIRTGDGGLSSLIWQMDSGWSCFMGYWMCF